MKQAYIKVLKRPGGLIYVSGLCLVMALFSMWLSLESQSADYAVHFANLCLYPTFALPFFVLRAFGPSALSADGDRAAEARGVFWGYLTWHGIGCALLSLYILPVAPSVRAFVCLAGFLVTGAVLTALTLLLSACIKRPVVALIASLALLIVLRELPEIGMWLTYVLGSAGAKIARALIQLSPYSLLMPFINGLVDLKAIAMAAAFVALIYALIKRRYAGDRIVQLWPPLLVYALIMAGLMIQPVNLTLIDLTSGQVTVASDQMELALQGVNRPVTVYQVADVGGEDAYVRGYMEKIDERHGYIDFVVLDPAEDDKIAALMLSDNSLVVEQDELFVIVHADDLYAASQVYFETSYTFELEGALLTALSDAVGTDLAPDGVPPGRTLNQRTLSIPRERALITAIAFLICPLALFIAGVVIIVWRRKVHVC